MPLPEITPILRGQGGYSRRELLAVSTALFFSARLPAQSSSPPREHQDKLVYGSDCSESTGRRPACVGANILDAIRRLASNKAIERKILYENAKRLLKL